MAGQQGFMFGLVADIQYANKVDQVFGEASFGGIQF